MLLLNGNATYVSIPSDQVSHNSRHVVRLAKGGGQELTCGALVGNVDTLSEFLPEGTDLDSSGMPHQSQTS